MNEKECIEKHVENTCYVIIQHIKNIINFQKNTNKLLGNHSRFIERLLHPEDFFIFKGKSKFYYENPDLVRRKEHIVPMTYLIDQLWDLILADKHSDKELSYILKRNLGIAYISYEESLRLDKGSGLKIDMPTGWNLEIDDPLDRLKAVGIILVNEDGQEIKTLK
jgi:hypothetical protein